MSPHVRLARSEDLEPTARLAGELVRMHHAVDPDRFFLPNQVESGYAWWFERELARKEARLFVAEAEGRILGYAYGTLEERDWNLLLDSHGAVHDIFVVEDARKTGVGELLVNALVSELEAMGAARILLGTMVSNTPAQRLFARCGFRPTMLEMTRSRGAAL
ncbi:MAG: GNAT family N-acetyltransferase [Polyangiaceae bacterium]